MVRLVLEEVATAPVLACAGSSFAAPSVATYALLDLARAEPRCGTESRDERLALGRCRAGTGPSFGRLALRTIDVGAPWVRRVVVERITALSGDARRQRYCVAIDEVDGRSGPTRSTSRTPLRSARWP